MLSLQVLRKDLDAGLDLLADVLLRPAFHPDELVRQRESVLATLRSQEDDPTTVAQKAFQRTLFGDTPYGHPVDGTTESVATLTRADVQHFYASYYRPAGAAIVVVGDVSADEIRPALMRAFGAWDGTPPPPFVYPPFTPPPAQTIHIDRPVTQAGIVIGDLGVARDNPDYETMQVMNYILGGGGFSSRLMDNIRTQAGLAYSVGSFFAAGKSPGPFEIIMQTKNASVSDAITRARQEVEPSATPRSPTTSWRRPSATSPAAIPLRLDSNAKIADFIAQTWFYGLGLNYADVYIKRVNAVTGDDVTRVARQYLRPERFIEVVVTAGDDAAAAYARRAPSGRALSRRWPPEPARATRASGPSAHPLAAERRVAPRPSRPGRRGARGAAHLRRQPRQRLRLGRPGDRRAPARGLRQRRRRAGAAARHSAVQPRLLPAAHHRHLPDRSRHRRRASVHLPSLGRPRARRRVAAALGAGRAAARGRRPARRSARCAPVCCSRSIRCTANPSPGPPAAPTCSPPPFCSPPWWCMAPRRGRWGGSAASGVAAFASLAAKEAGVALYPLLAAARPADPRGAAARSPTGCAATPAWRSPASSYVLLRRHALGEFVGTAPSIAPTHRSPMEIAAAVGTYVGKLLWPWPLNAYIDRFALTPWRSLAGLLLLGAAVRRDGPPVARVRRRAAALRAAVDRPHAGAVAGDPLEDSRRAAGRALSLPALGGILPARRRSRRRAAGPACRRPSRVAPPPRSARAAAPRRRRRGGAAQPRLARRHRPLGGHRGEEPGVGHGGPEPRHRLPAGRPRRRRARRLRARARAPQRRARPADDPQQPRHAGDDGRRLPRRAARLRAGAGRRRPTPPTRSSTSAWRCCTAAARRPRRRGARCPSSSAPSRSIRTTPTSRPPWARCTSSSTTSRRPATTCTAPSSCARQSAPRGHQADAVAVRVKADAGVPADRRPARRIAAGSRQRSRLRQRVLRRPRAATAHGAPCSRARHRTSLTK